ncbi:protein serine/threonine kinase, putative, partial [Entamoeba invadens IP1]
MYPEEISGICKSCDATFNSQCNTSNGYCSACKTNYVFNPQNPKKCLECKQFDGNCSVCALSFERKCSSCEEGYYPNDNSICVACDTIPNCVNCKINEKKCLSCNDPFYQLNGECKSCPNYQYKKSQTSCDNCYEKVRNCKLCTTKTMENVLCDECYPPYVAINGICVSCQSNEYYDTTTKSCLTINNCERPTNSTSCISCEPPYFVSNSKCVNANGCNNPSKLSITSCDCNDQISVNSYCTSKIPTCKYQKSVNGTSKCVQCDNNLILENGKCITVPLNMFWKNNITFICSEGYYLSNENICKMCNQNDSICENYNNVISSLKCKDSFTFNIEKKTCLSDENCETIQNGLCTKCKNITSELSSGKCSKCQTTSCEHCEGSHCKMCMSNYLLSKNNFCVFKTNVNCLKSTRFGCALCNNGYYSVDSINKEGKYDFCIKAPVTNCKHYHSNLTKCVECLDAFQLKNSVCSESFNELEEKTPISLKLTIKGIETVGCSMRDSKGCKRCLNGYYLDNNECIKCGANCKTCSDSVYCTSCEDGSFIDTNYRCQSLGDLSKKCKIAMPSGGGCAICKDGYFKSGIDCNECDDSCYNCDSRERCLSCKNGYFRIPLEKIKLCLSYDSNLNCTVVNPDGCILCATGFYLSNGRCVKCDNNCLTCVDGKSCTSCIEDYVAVEHNCLHYNLIEHCTTAKESKCTTCEGRNIPSDDGERCVGLTNYGVVIGIPISIFVVLIILIAIIIVVGYLFAMRKKEEKKMINVCVFQMKRSNVPMFAINDVLSTSKKEIHFDLEEDPPINVDSETRDLICIGNNSKHNVKVQFSVMEGCDHYEIRTVPSLISLKRGEACEFEIFIKPSCSCKISEDIMLIALDIMTGVQMNERIHVETTTKNSTKLDYRELTEEKKLGEGSFGIVYKGKYLNKTVAIKKMKNTQATKEAIDEFDKEVSMLDKFRSEFVIHFYGACYIPSHICMVTEFAEHGSLADMINKEKEISLKMKVKIIWDGARGIKYLHENGILHRDIKPDNILVITMEENVKANGKLTDFGSSRNINMLMTNMTFTKGIGTPKYMAPEVLNKQHYKKSSDVFSLGVTMYEALVWGEVYPKNIFKFAWSIADFVTSGKRRECQENMNVEAYNIVDQ